MTILIWMGYTPSISQEHLIAKYSNDKSEFLADTRGLRVHYRDQGVRDGKVIVMLHANSNSLHNFERYGKNKNTAQLIISGVSTL